MPRDWPALLAARAIDSLHAERIIPRFVDSYVVQYGRYALQTHPTRYRELLALIAREALLAMAVCVLEEADLLTAQPQASSARAKALRPRAFRQAFLSGLARQQKWSAGDALDFQSELRMYEELLCRRPSGKRARKPFEAADHPFVDRCAILLDPSFIEQARIASSQALGEIESLARTLAQRMLRGEGS